MVKEVKFLLLFGEIVTGNIFSLVNTCIENASELQVIDGMKNSRLSAAQYTELVSKLIDDPMLRAIILDSQEE